MTLILETCVLYIKDHYQASNISINAPVSTPEGGRGEGTCDPAASHQELTTVYEL